MLMQLIQIGLASLLLVVFMWPRNKGTTPLPKGSNPPPTFSKPAPPANPPRKKYTHHNSCGCEHEQGDKHDA